MHEIKRNWISTVKDADLRLSSPKNTPRCRAGQKRSYTMGLSHATRSGDRTFLPSNPQSESPIPFYRSSCSVFMASASSLTNQMCKKGVNKPDGIRTNEHGDLQIPLFLLEYTANFQSSKGGAILPTFRQYIPFRIVSTGCFLRLRTLLCRVSDTILS